MPKPFLSPSIARSISTQEPAWVVWSGFLLPLLIVSAMTFVLWRQSQSAWVFILLLLLLVTCFVKQYQRIRHKQCLFLQFTDNQWYVVNQQGELYEVYLLHNWRSPWWLSLQFTIEKKPAATRHETKSTSEAHVAGAGPKLNVTVWRQKITINHWRNINLALNRYNAYAKSQPTKEPS